MHELAQAKVLECSESLSFIGEVYDPVTSAKRHERRMQPHSYDDPARRTIT